MRQTWESIERVEAHHPRYLVGQDAAYAWFINGVGQTHRQTVIDTHSSGTFARLYIGKAPVTAPDLLHDSLIPFSEDRPLHQVAVPAS